eukprot:11813507-Alexandrium_andersonii.AAC.1
MSAWTCPDDATACCGVPRARCNNSRAAESRAKISLHDMVARGLPARASQLATKQSLIMGLVL